MPHLVTLYATDDLQNIPPQTTHLEVFLAAEEPLTAAALALLPAGLRCLHIKSIAADALAQLPERLPALEELRIDINALGADGLAPLARLKQLQTIQLTSQRDPLPDLSPVAHASAMSVMVQGDPQTFVDQLPKLAALKRLETWSFPRFEAKHMAAIAALPALAELRLGGSASRVTHAMAGLKGAPALRKVAFEGCDPLSAKEADALATIPTLRAASVRVYTADDVLALRTLHDKVERLSVMVGTNKDNGDAFLNTLVDSLPNVAVLNVMALNNHGRSGTSYTAAGLARLGELKRVEWLSLGYLVKAIKPADMGWLAALPALKHLIVSGAGMSAKLVDALTGCAALRTLELDQLKLSDAAVKKLAGLPLERLKLTEAPLTDKGFAALGQMKTLRALYVIVEKGQLGDVGLQALGALPALEVLYVNLRYSTYNATTLAPLAAIPTLEILSIDPHAQSVTTPGGLSTLVGAPALCHIELGAYSEGPLDAPTAAALKTIPTLRVVGSITANHELLRGHALATAQHGYYPIIAPFMQDMI
jgi:hypothetical protein